jgi:hypothetical protein
MLLVIEPFLLDANQRALQLHKRAYCHVVGLGLGVWMLDDTQGSIIVAAFKDVIQRRDLSSISDIDFSYFPPESQTQDGFSDGQKITTLSRTQIVIHFSSRDPASPLNDNTKLLVAMYAWDSNAYPGNEYWLDSLTGSGDPAAACCSTIAELQNPEINPQVSGDNAWYWTHSKAVADHIVSSHLPTPALSAFLPFHGNHHGK